MKRNCDLLTITHPRNMTTAVVEGGIVRTAAHKYREKAPATYGRSAGAGMTAMQAINLAMGITDKKEEEDAQKEEENAKDQDDDDDDDDEDINKDDVESRRASIMPSATFLKEPNSLSGNIITIIIIIIYTT